jgi:diamine N-acetyltransferase
MSNLQSSRVKLRLLEREDGPLLFEWINNKDLVVFNAPFKPITASDHESWMERMLQKSPGRVFFVIEDLATSQMIGSCQLFNIHPIHRSAELQIRIGNMNYWGSGYGSEAVSLLCKFAFKDLNLHRIYLNVFSSNTRAIKSYEKCGFSIEGISKDAAWIEGSWLDVAIMSKLNNYEHKQ